jgi:ABC-type oligopeptide transport system substrate-binding subunit
VTVQPALHALKAGSGGTLRVLSEEDVDSMDPALAYVLLSWQMLYPSCAKLLNYPDRGVAPGGAAGSRLEPEVAQSLPERSADGKTYTFTIRKDFRFSPPSNAPVTAQTFKYTIERSLNPKMKSPVRDAGYLASVVGANAYMQGRRSTSPGLSPGETSSSSGSPSRCRTSCR